MDISPKENFHIDLSVGAEGISKAVEIGIEIEKTGEKFYREKAARAKIPYVRQYLEKLADEEVKHQQLLRELKVSLTERGSWIDVRVPETKDRIKELAIFGKEKGPHIKESSDTVEALNEAMKLEDRSKEFYLNLSFEMKNPDGKKFFQELADWEESHKELLNAMREVLLGVAGTWG